MSRLPWSDPALTFTCWADVRSSTRNPFLRASPTATAARLWLWQEKHPAFGTKLASVRCRSDRLLDTAASIVLPRRIDTGCMDTAGAPLVAPDFNRRSTTAVLPWNFARSSAVRPVSPDSGCELLTQMALPSLP